MFNKRIIRVGLEIDKKVRWYEGLSIEAQIKKTTSPQENTATVVIINLSKETRMALATKTDKRLWLEVGTERDGIAQIFTGDITKVSISQPPDISTTIVCDTKTHERKQPVSKSFKQIQTKAIATDIAKDLDLSLQFEATNKALLSYSHTGNKINQIENFKKVGGIDVFIDDDTLVVKDLKKAKKNEMVVLHKGSGMLGMPEAKEDDGIQVTSLYNPNIVIGGAVEIKSELVEELNGVYEVQAISYNITNKNEKWEMSLECQKW